MTTLRERRRERARETPVTLSNGLTVHGTATAFERRSEHFIGEYFRPGGVEARPGMTVLDIGANIGLFSLEVLHRCGGDARIYAFEPAPDTFAYLERNLRELFPAAPVRTFRQAVAERAGTATFHHRPGASVNSSLFAHVPTDWESLLEASLREPPEEYRHVVPRWFRRLPHGLAKRILRQGYRLAGGDVVPIDCRVTTVSDVLRDEGIERVDYLKVDVEGAELDVLRGITPADWPRIARIGAEVHDVDGRLATVRRLLELAGFDDVTFEQDWPFEGTNVHMLHARRTA